MANGRLIFHGNGPQIVGRYYNMNPQTGQFSLTYNFNNAKITGGTAEQQGASMRGGGYQGATQIPQRAKQRVSGELQVVSVNQFSQLRQSPTKEYKSVHHHMIEK
jgi:hypothetical protein